MSQMIPRFLLTLAGASILAASAQADTNPSCGIDFRDRVVVAGQALAKRAYYPHEKKAIYDAFFLRLQALDTTQPSNYTLQYLANDARAHDAKAKPSAEELAKMAAKNNADIAWVQNTAATPEDRAAARKRIDLYQNILGTAEVDQMIHFAEARYFACLISTRQP